MSKMRAADRVIFNTAVSYIVLLFKMAVGIFSVRFILIALGETNYGIYIAVAGVIALLDMLGGSMTNTSMRYLAYSLGGGEIEKIRDTFRTTLYVHYIIGLVTALIMEICGIFFIECIMDIPPDKIIDAQIIFQLMIISTFISIIAVPYDAVMNAHEHIWVLSLFDAFSAVLALGMAIFLMYSPGNRLIVYGFYQLGILIVIRILKVYYSKRHFVECRKITFKNRNKKLVSELLSFTGWTFFGNLSAALKTHLRGIIINVFFGVRLNAAEGISRQVNNYVNMVAVSMTKAINPQMNKSEGSGDRDRMKRVLLMASKYSTFLFALVGVPLMIETPYIFSLWLKDVPNYAVVFCQISLLTMLIAKFTGQIGHAIYAVGKIKFFQSLEVAISFVILLFTYVVFKMGYSPTAAYWVELIGVVFITIERFFMGKRIIGLKLTEYTTKTIFPSLFPILLAGGVSIMITMFLPPSFKRLIITALVYITLFVLLFFMFGVEKEEKKIWANIAAKVKIKGFKQI